eukprot:scaffold6479_cov101-Isochrysis_galbana.AAC.3
MGTTADFKTGLTIECASSQRMRPHRPPRIRLWAGQRLLAAPDAGAHAVAGQGLRVCAVQAQEPRDGQHSREDVEGGRGVWRRAGGQGRDEVLVFGRRRHGLHEHGDLRGGERHGPGGGRARLPNDKGRCGGGGARAVRPLAAAPALPAPALAVCLAQHRSSSLPRGMSSPMRPLPRRSPVHTQNRSVRPLASPSP